MSETNPRPHFDANRTSLKKAVGCIDSNAKNTLWDTSTLEEFFPKADEKEWLQIIHDGEN